MFLPRCSVILIILVFSSICRAKESNVPTSVIRTLPIESKAYTSHDYIVKTLLLALSETKKEYGNTRLEYIPINIDHLFNMHLLDVEGFIDITASGVNKEREINFKSVRFPIYKGLLGYRMFLISPKKKKLFQHINTEQQLKSLKVCQVYDWVDADILQDNGYNLIRKKHLQDIYKALGTGECDYFPRGIIEGYTEAKTYNAGHPNHPIYAFDDFLIYYNLPMVFYTSHQDFELAARVELGLKRANKDGKLLKLLKTNKITKSVFPLSKWKHKHVFYLKNRGSVKSISIYDKSLWLTLPTK